LGAYRISHRSILEIGSLDDLLLEKTKLEKCKEKNPRRSEADDATFHDGIGTGTQSILVPTAADHVGPVCDSICTGR
ncbi:MAG: hypothetical protein VX574_12245, partial [Myxococcota bacterium]|nr:hypothetical protein [Myxococcota bacterium]